LFDLYLITPELPSDRIERAVAQALERAVRLQSGGRVGVQLRAKHLDAIARNVLGVQLRARTRAAGAALLVSGDLGLCGALDADGVQLPEHGPSVAEVRACLGADVLIGASRHDLPGIVRAQREGASFATLSPICASPGKGPPLGFEALARIAGAVELPVFALGGIGVREAPQALAAGAHGLAVIRSVLGADDPARAVEQLLACLDQRSPLDC
jgi:thiamine-phosphate pyrophosphorylase